MNDKVPPPTSAEITRRLHTVTELRNLCLSLGQARRVVERAPAVGSGRAKEKAEQPSSGDSSFRGQGAAQEESEPLHG